MSNNPQYVIESFFKGEVNNTVGPRCQFRRYVIDIYVNGCIAKCGKLTLEHKAGILYYFGNIPTSGIDLKIHADTKRRAVNGTLPMPKENPDNDRFYGYDLLKTDAMTIEWSAKHSIDASNQKKRIARIMMYFGRWGMAYSEIEKYPADEMISVNKSDGSEIDGIKAWVSKNRYLGTVAPDPPELPPTCPPSIEFGALLSRFAVLADAHIGVRYNWENYDWLHGIFENLEKIHAEAPIDFVVQLGDNIDDGYAKTYQTDYEIYLSEIKHLKICDPESPLKPADGKIPNYELQGNHDPSADTRFFREKLWYTENAVGEKVAYISFFSSYGGYPLVNFNIAGDYNSYRSYGKLSDETADFVDKSIEEAKANSAKHIVLFSHFGISQDVGAPILPESGLKKIESVCKKHNIKLYFSGHEHNVECSHRMYKQIHNLDISMLKDKYAIAEIYENVCKVVVYDTQSGKICREELISLI